jgi:hypothetical protein
MHDLILDGCERPVVDFEESWRWQCIDTLSFHAIWLPMIHALWHVCLSWVQKSGSVKNDLLLDFSFCLFLIWRVAIERIDYKASLSLFYRDFLSNQSIQDSFMQGVGWPSWTSGQFFFFSLMWMSGPACVYFD